MTDTVAPKADLILRCLAYDLMCGSGDDDVRSRCGITDSEAQQVRIASGTAADESIEASGRLSDEIWGAVFAHFGTDRVNDPMLEFCDFNNDFASEFIRIGEPIRQTDGILAMTLLLAHTHHWAASELQKLLHEQSIFPSQLVRDCGSLMDIQLQLVTTLERTVGDKRDSIFTSGRPKVIATLDVLVQSLPRKPYAEALRKALLTHTSHVDGTGK